MSKSSRRRARNKQRQRVDSRPAEKAAVVARAAPAKRREPVARREPIAPRRAATESGSVDDLHALLAPTTALFVSPVGWTVAALFVFLVSGFGFIAPVTASQQATMVGVFGVITNFLMVVLIPVVTMRVLAEERSRGTLELLMTSPVRDWELATGKWLAAFTFYLLLLATTLVYVAILRYFAAGLDLGLMAATYLGLVLVGGAAVAIGVLASSLTRNQIVAFFLAMVALLVTWYAGYLIGYFVAPPANLFFEYIGGLSRFQSFMLGQVTLRDTVYFLTLIVVALFLTTRVTASRRWR